ncbi:carbohydrate ABC transporter permease [Peribacillus muralis]|uniref:carbohydrate ABC transporter permease n=1 Tax=Peribacillus muralis TaxID=264697 RepID=UPI00070E1BA1|nr:carbohydrate ABC transporter permease [Peribacillus muralis]
MKGNIKQISWNLTKYISLLIGAIVVLIPPLVVLFSSFKTKIEYLNTDKLSLPDSFLNFENYKVVFEQGNLDVAFKNTAIILVISLIGNVIIGSCVAYALGRFDFKLKKVILGAYLVAIMIPSITTQVSTYGIITNLGVNNTLFAPILLYLGADVLMIYIYLQFIESIPKELDEAAMIEGASYFTIFTKVIFPLLAPATSTVIIIKAIAIYNDFYIPFLYIPSEELSVVSTVAYKFMGPFGGEWNVICAGVIMIIIPTIVLFLVLQRFVYSGMTNGSVK